MVDLSMVRWGCKCYEWGDRVSSRSVAPRSSNGMAMATPRDCEINEHQLTPIPSTNSHRPCQVRGGWKTIFHECSSKILKNMAVSSPCGDPHVSPADLSCGQQKHIDRVAGWAHFGRVKYLRISKDP